MPLTLTCLRGFVWCWLALVLTSLAGAPAQGQSDILGTHEVRAGSSRVGGKTTECVLGFRAMARDRTQTDGRLISLTGEFGVAAPTGGRPHGFLKLVVHDLIRGPSDLQSIPVRPHGIFLAAAGHQTGLSRLDEKDTAPDGATLATFALDENFVGAMMDAINAARLTVAFRRPGGALDVSAELDLTVTATDDALRRSHGTSQVDAFAHCLSRLLA